MIKTNSPEIHPCALDGVPCVCGNYCSLEDSWLTPELFAEYREQGLYDLDHKIHLAVRKLIGWSDDQPKD